MTDTRPSIFREALTLVRPALVLKQLALALLIGLLSLMWLRLPDASVYWLALTVVLGFIGVILTGVGESFLLLHLAGRPRTRRRLALGTTLFLIAAVLWYVSGNLIDHFSANDGLRASYLNSRFGQSWRYLFTYEHITQWESCFWSASQALLDGLLLACLLAPITAANAASAIVGTLFSLCYWLAIVLAFWVAPALTDKLEWWVPGHGLPVEMTSFVLRLAAIAIMDAVVACFLLAAIVVCVRRANTLYLDSTPAGTLLESQPRTDIIP